MNIFSAKRLLDIVRDRGLRVVVHPKRRNRLVVIRPEHVSPDEVSPPLLDALLAWRNEVIEELQSPAICSRCLRMIELCNCADPERVVDEYECPF